MGKVIFSIQYKVEKQKREEYLTLIKELKNLLKVDGLETYAIYEVKGKPNHFQEIYTFSSPEAYEAFDDDQNERMNILVNKINDLTAENSTRYTTLFEISEN
jgi:quinol monooxygenase YgiN